MRPLLLIVAAALAAVAATPVAAAPGRISGEPAQAQEWWLASIGADRATPPGPGVPLTVVDGGLDVSNPDFAGRPNTNLLDDQTAAEGDYHGTQVALLAAAPANGAGLLGVYPQVVLQSWDASPAGSLVVGSAADGIMVAAQHCPGVINLSFGSTTRYPSIEDAVLYAVHRGCLVVAAGGNKRETGNVPTFPAALPHVLTVAATDRSDAVGYFSSASLANDLAAPGVGLTDGIHELDGTSFAAPLVSAAAAWVWTARPTLDESQIFGLLRSTARDVGPPGFDLDTGYGVLDIPQALAAPAPPSDPLEPNDDVDQVKPGALFTDGQPALTTRAEPSIRIAGSLDVTEDPRDLYRIWVPAHRVVHVSVAAAGNATARIWGPRTVSVDEDLAARRRDLRGQAVSGGAHGFAAYVEVLLTGRSAQTDYVLGVRASSR